MTQKICTFAGHGEIYGENTLKEKLKKEIINLIERYGVNTFYNGGKGQFDWLCADCVKELRKDYPFIKSYLILAYMPVKKNQFDADFYKKFDDTLYPEIEKVPPKFAIVKRNEWVIDNSSFLITYINHKWGGAYRTLEYAKRKKHIQFINIAN
ncbi:MAG: DUF1273 family protein [Alphaproteobacteria bacterium]|nr:DUF1273 family protein [Alphaproteobacteria bacterium]